MTIAYLDPDDEITSAVARLRASDDVRVALVLPPGSRIATSRINFRLLAHEALEHQRLLAIVAGEAGVRAVAVSAGLPAYASVVEYEASLDAARAAGAAAVPAVETVAPVRRKARRSLAADVQALPPAAAATAAVTVAAPAGAPTTRRRRDAGAQPDLPVVATHDRARSGGRRGPWIALSAVLVVALIVAAGWVAFNVLPTASITIVPGTKTVGPVNVTVTADPNATAVDVASGVVPAQTVTLPLTATGTFNATGTKPVDATATGTVTFVSFNTGRSVAIPQGTQVSTQSGIAFQTTKTVVVPRAKPLDPNGGRASVGVTALASGPVGNVPAGAIDRVAASIETALVNFGNPVTNAAPTTGGTHTLVQVVKQADYDAAMAALQAELKTQLDTAARDASNVPQGVTLIPATATVGQVTADQPPATIVNKQEPTFPLTLSGNGTIEGVDPGLVAQVATGRLATSVPSGYRLFPGSVEPQVGPAVVSGGTITFSASASGQMAESLDASALVRQVQGRSVVQARAILEPLGAVTIETWPFYVGSVPDDPGRVTLKVAAPQAPGGASPGASPTAAPTTAPPASAS